MKFLYSNDTIIACSTNLFSNAAIAVIRISGFEFISQFNSFFTKDLTGPIEPRKVYFTKLVLQGQVIDEICLTYFSAPHSYNGENILELSVHGNTLNVERIIELFTQNGDCRTAFPGEFTYRALKNKKLNLSQVEGLDLFLNANSGYALDQGLSLLNGNLHLLYQEIYDLFLVHKSSLELSIDFSDDIGEEAAKDYFLTTLNNLLIKFESLFKRVQPLDGNLFNPQIVLAGLPNAGKSSLFNKLLSDDRAIVSPVAGTTRDFISENLVIGGVKYQLVDTAGVRESSDFIETEGIKRTKKILKESFYSVFLINPFETTEGLNDLLSLSFDLIVFTHCDQVGFSDAKQRLVSTYPILGPIGAINIKGDIRDFEIKIHTEVNKKYLSLVRSKPILLDRHKLLISDGYKIAKEYQALSFKERDVAVLSHELNTLGHCISELVGIVSPDEVLNSIFSNFCIGK